MWVNINDLHRAGQRWFEILALISSPSVYKRFMQTILGAPGNVTKILAAENGQKVDEFEPIYLGKYRF